MTKKQKANAATGNAPSFKKSTGFVPCANDVIYRADIPMGVKMLYAYAMGLPEGWKWRRRFVCDTLGIGVATYKKYMRLAKATGTLRPLLTVRREKSEWFYNWAYNPFFDDPSEGKPTSVIPASRSFQVELWNGETLTDLWDGEKAESEADMGQKMTPQKNEGVKKCRLPLKKIKADPQKNDPLNQTHRETHNHVVPISKEIGSQGSLLEQQSEPRECVDATVKSKKTESRRKKASGPTNPERARRYELARGYLRELYEEFLEALELDAEAFPPTAQDWVLGHQRFGELANQLRIDANGGFKDITAEAWTERTADAFRYVMRSYLENDRLHGKAWNRFCAAGMFRSLLGPEKKASRL